MIRKMICPKCNTQMKSSIQKERWECKKCGNIVDWGSPEDLKYFHKIKSKGKTSKKRKKAFLTPKNYKKFGYEHYSKVGKKYYFSFTNEDGDEEFYDSKGHYHSTMN